jgi:LysM repeat protein
LAVLGLLVVSIILFLLPALLGGGDGTLTGALPSPSAGSQLRPLATRAPLATAEASASPSPTPEPEIRVYTVKSGDTLSGIAADPKVRTSVRLLQCFNGLTNPNLLQLGQKLLIPPDGYNCPAGWRRASASPDATLAPEASPAAEGSPGA